MGCGTNKHGRRLITMNSKLTTLTKKGFTGEFFASVVSFASFVMGVRDSSAFTR